MQDIQNSEVEGWEGREGTGRESERSSGALLKGTSCRLHWDQPQGHRESKELLTRCALHQTGPPPGNRARAKAQIPPERQGRGEGRPTLPNPRLNSAEAPAL